jgi:transposase
MIMPNSSPTYRLFVGVDIAAATFTATWWTGQSRAARPATFEQTAAGYTAFQDKLTTSGIGPDSTLVVMEATGSYWITLAVTLHAAGYHVSIVNPRHIHNYAKSLPSRGKTDAIDAELLTQFAVERQPPTWNPPPSIYHELRQRLTAREALIAMRQQARNHRHALQQWPVVIASVLEELDGTIADIDRRITALERAITTNLHEGAWADSAAFLESIPGVGSLTAAWLLVSTLNFTVAKTAPELTAYAGLAPLPYESGQSIRGRRQIGHGGNKRLRTVLYMATLSATQHNPMIQPFYDRLRAAGKPMRVARCAAARKLLHLAWAVVKNQQRFDPAHHGPLTRAGAMNC